MPAPTTLSMPQRHVGEPYRFCLVWELMGKCRRLQHCLGSVMSGRSHGTVLQVYRVRSSVLRLTWVPCLAFSVCFLVLTERASPVGWVPVGSDCTYWRRAVSRGSAHPRSETRVGVENGVWPGLPAGEAVRRRAGIGSERCSSFVRPSGRRGGPELEAGVVPPRPGLPAGDWIVLLACRLGSWADPRAARLFAAFICWTEPLHGSRS